MEWADDPSTSIEEIDNQLKELLQRGRCLINECGKVKGRDEIDRLLDNFQDYVVTHFGAEEQHMVCHAYPRYDAHKAEHMLFISALSGLREKLAVDGCSIQVVFETIRIAAEWIAYHARTTDVAMGAFLRAKRSSSLQDAIAKKECARNEAAA